MKTMAKCVFRIAQFSLFQHPRSSVSSTNTVFTTRTMVSLPWPFSLAPRDFSVPNSSWGSEMTRLYEHYNSLCEAEKTPETPEKTPDGAENPTPEEAAVETPDERTGAWRRLPSYNRTLKYVPGGVYLSKIVQSKARLFTRNIRAPGAAFEYVMFINDAEHRSVCVFQAGHLLEGPPGHVHGGAIATMIDSVTGTHASYIAGPGPVMTANLNINYRSPIPLGSTVLIHSALDRKEGRKTYLTCRVTSTDESKIHTEATGLFLSISVGHLLR